MDRALWRLRFDILWIHCLLALVKVRGITRTRSEIHGFLFDRYFRLAELHRKRGDARRARRLHLKADWHRERRDPDPPSPVAAALGRPGRGTFTWSVGGRPKPTDHP